jgi:hypothetical protein
MAALSKVSRSVWVDDLLIILLTASSNTELAEFGLENLPIRKPAAKITPIPIISKAYGGCFFFMP